MSGNSSTLRFPFWDWAQAVVLSANLAWTTTCLGGFRAQTMVVTSALTALLLCTYAGSVLASRHAVVGRAHPAGWFYVPFLVYAVANVLWVTPVRWLGWIDWFGWVEAFIVFWVALNGLSSRRSRRVVWTTLFCMALVTVGCGAYQRFVQPGWLMLHRVQVAQYTGRASGVFGIPNSMAALLLLLLPISGALCLRPRASAVARVFFGWMTLVLVFGLGLTISRGAWIGLALALTAWPLLGSQSNWRRRALLAGGVLAGVIVIGGLTYLSSERARGRLNELVRDVGERSRPILWRAGWQMVRAHPLVGTGAGSFDVEFERYRLEGFIHQPKWAHNDYLNTLSDYGGIGFLLLFGAVAVTVAGCRRPDPVAPSLPQVGRTVGLRQPRDAFDDRWVRQGQAIGLLAFALQLFVDFHFKIPALAMACASVAGFAVRSAWPVVASADSDSTAETGSIRASIGAVRFFAAAGWAAVAVVVLAMIVPLYRSEALREEARERIDRLAGEPADPARVREQIAGARLALTRATELAPQNARVWSDLAYATAQWSLLEPSQTAALGREAEVQANRAIALSPGLAEFWIRHGVAQDMQGRWSAAGDDFTHAIALARMTPLPWYHYAYHLTLRPIGLDLAPAMVETCLRLDPKNPEALRLRHQLATGQTRP